MEEEEIRTEGRRRKEKGERRKDKDEVSGGEYQMILLLC
jgi:hypothetical protein